jgi:tRNA dimethylallyltransferase
LSTLQQQLEPPPFVFAAFALLPTDRPELYARIDGRFLQMMQQGFLDEVRLLRARSDLNADLPSLRSVGYRQLWAHLAGDLGLDDAIARAQRATRNLAKRQLTWIRSEPAFAGLHGLEDQELAPIKGAIAAVLDRG